MNEVEWWSLVSGPRFDPVGFLAFADWLEERGDERSWALRWIAHEQRFPRISSCVLHLDVDSDNSWDWWKAREQWGPEVPETLPLEVFQSLPQPPKALSRWDNTGSLREYETVEQAYRALVTALMAVGGNT